MAHVAMISCAKELDGVEISTRLVATFGVLRVDVDPLECAEGAEHLAVVHALEDTNQLVLIKDQSN